VFSPLSLYVVCFVYWPVNSGEWGWWTWPERRLLDCRLKRRNFNKNLHNLLLLVVVEVILYIYIYALVFWNIIFSYNVVVRLEWANEIDYKHIRPTTIICVVFGCGWSIHNRLEIMHFYAQRKKTKERNRKQLNNKIVCIKKKLLDCPDCAGPANLPPL